MVCSDACPCLRSFIERGRLLMDFNAIPTLGSVRERLGYFATITEEGELNTTLNNACNYIYELETEIKRLQEWKSHE
jgi:hypothetical protein